MPIERQTPSVAAHDPETSRRYQWYQRLTSILLIIFCLELGCFLLVFPWSGETWENNFFSSLLRHRFWDNTYLRGAVSGLGVVNLYISLIEMLRLRRLW
jgi:hypothetical protein